MEWVYDVPIFIWIAVCIRSFVTAMNNAFKLQFLARHSVYRKRWDMSTYTREDEITEKKKERNSSRESSLLRCEIDSVKEAQNKRSTEQINMFPKIIN